MTKVPSLNFDKVIKTLRRDGWVMIRQRGSHIRLQKTKRNETLKLTIPAHKPIKRSTLAHILKQTGLTVTSSVQRMHAHPRKAKGERENAALPLENRMAEGRGAARARYAD